MFSFTYSILAVLVLSLLYLETASAQCTCAKPNITALQEFKDATVVFTSEITGIQKSAPDAQDRYYETVKITVDRAWKENIDAIVTIRNYVHGCVQGWNIGDKYLVYAYRNEDKATYTTGCCCSRTGKLEKTEKDIAAFYDAGYSRSHVNSARIEKIISAGWMNSRAINFQQPAYPPGIKKSRPAARVDVRIATDVNGNVISADVTRGPADFHAAALAAARTLKFPATSLSGVPTKVSGWVSFGFKP